MRASQASRIEPVSARAFELPLLGWLQAGFGSFAYRLAHLRAHRPAVLGTLAVIFYIV
jgi:hypothetical protein